MSQKLKRAILSRLLKSLSLITKLSFIRFFICLYIIGFIFTGVYLNFLYYKEVNLLFSLFFGIYFHIIIFPFIAIFKNLIFDNLFFKKTISLYKVNSKGKKLYLNRSFIFTKCSNKMLKCDTIFKIWYAKFLIRQKYNLKSFYKTYDYLNTCHEIKAS